MSARYTSAESLLDSGIDADITIKLPHDYILAHREYLFQGPEFFTDAAAGYDTEVHLDDQDSIAVWIMLRHIYNPESFPDARTDRDEQAVAKYWNVFVLGVKYKYPELSAKALHAFKVALEQRRVGEMLDWMVPDVYNLESDDLRPLKSALVDNLSTKLSLVEGSEQESKFRDVARRVPESAEDIA